MRIYSQEKGRGEPGVSVSEWKITTAFKGMEGFSLNLLHRILRKLENFRAPTLGEFKRIQRNPSQVWFGSNPWSSLLTWNPKCTSFLLLHPSIELLGCRALIDRKLYAFYFFFNPCIFVMVLYREEGIFFPCGD